MDGTKNSGLLGGLLVLMSSSLLGCDQKDKSETSAATATPQQAEPQAPAAPAGAEEVQRVW